MSADTLQGRIEMIVTLIKCLVIIVRFVADYFPDRADGNEESRWKFYEGVFE